VTPNAAGGTIVQAANISFTPPTSGTAYLRGRGWCNVEPATGVFSGINIAAGPTLAGVFTSSASDWGVVRIAPDASIGLYQQGWTSESTLAVTAGVLTNAFLGIRHEIGTNTTDSCSGSFTAEVYTGTLP
jgi:hypothetical protein